MVRAIVAVDPALAIGREGTLPWHSRADLKQFRKATLGHAVVMGRLTFDSIGRPLPERDNYVLSRSAPAPAGTRVLRSAAEVAELAERLPCDVVVIGGAEVYAALAPLIREWRVTRFPERVPDADTYLPAGIFEGFELASRETLEDGLVVETLRRSRPRG